MLERKMRWGILSTANIGRAAVIPAIQSSKNGEVAAVASRDAQKGAEFAARMGIPKAYNSYSALLDDPEIEAVYIPLPNSLHYEWTIKAAQAGKHILCEKPLALSAAQCHEMHAAAKEGGVLLMEAFMYRFHPRTEKVIEWVRAGALGSLQMIQSSFTFKLTNPDNIRLRADLGGGALMDVGSYCVNLSRTLAGEEPVAAQATARWAASGVDEQLVGTLRFANGLMAQFDCALTMARRESYTAAGTDGYYYAPAAFLPGKEDIFLSEFRDRKETQHPFSGCDEYQLMVEHFTDCILKQEQPRYSTMDAAANMRVIETLYQSARRDGTWQSVLPLTGYIWG
jgi:D-xylose 1-dehydrogenase (NADP+, D-xylono-1,5-lactone-forming)